MNTVFAYSLSNIHPHNIIINPRLSPPLTNILISPLPIYKHPLEYTLTLPSPPSQCRCDKIFLLESFKSGYSKSCGGYDSTPKVQKPSTKRTTNPLDQHTFLPKQPIRTPSQHTLSPSPPSLYPHVYYTRNGKSSTCRETIGHPLAW